MSDSVIINVIKPLEAGYHVRNENGQTKTINFNGKRTVLTSASLKKPTREYMEDELMLTSDARELRTANTSGLIRTTLATAVSEGELNLSDKQIAACTKAVLNVYGISKKENDEKDTTVMVTTIGEFRKQMESLIVFLKGITPEEWKSNDFNLESMLKEKKIIKKASSLSILTALFGVMSTGNIVETVYGATLISDAYSIDRYAGDYNFWTATHCSSDVKGDDIFSKAMRQFRAEELSKPGSETMGDNTTAANIFNENAVIDLHTLYENLITGRTHEECVDAACSAVRAFLRVFPLAVPAAGQHSHFTNPMPCSTFVQVLENAPTPLSLAFETPISNDVANKAVERVGKYSAETDSLYSGATRHEKYAVLGMDYQDKAQAFEGCNLESAAGMIDRVTASVREILNGYMD